MRPLHSIVATFGPETEDPDIVPFSVDGIVAGDTTRGHRFLAPAAFKVRRLDDYAAKLEQAKVVLDPERRKASILADAKNLAFAQGYELVEDEGLLTEVAGLVEWPVVLMGAFEERSWHPARGDPRHHPQQPEMLRAATADGTAVTVILVANTGAGRRKAIVAGNERVIRARLADAKFFYETDLKTRLEDRLPKFEHIVFHERLGTQAQRIARIERLAVELASTLGADRKKVRRATWLAKADLLTEVVGEFPELQGLMGRYYAEAQGEDEAVAHACEDHYKPKGPDDLVPADPVAVAVGLADRIDTLVAFWAIDEKPTGSKDPYALRRAALGVIRLVLGNQTRRRLFDLFVAHALQFFASPEDRVRLASMDVYRVAGRSSSQILVSLDQLRQGVEELRSTRMDLATPIERALFTAGDLLTFFADRLKVQLREQGARHDLVDAVFSLEGQNDLVRIVRRVEALGRFLDTDDGRNLLAGSKRAANILRIEEKRDGTTFTGTPDPQLYAQAEERGLAEAIDVARREASAAVEREDFEAAMRAMAHLRPHVDAFFDKVTVNTDDRDVRANRLRLLNEIRAATLAVADFSKIEG